MITDPTDIDAGVIWLDVDDLTGTHGGNAGSTWTDSGSNAISFSAASGQEPEYRDGRDYYHGKPCLRFTRGTSDKYTASNAALDSTNATAFIVVYVRDIETFDGSNWIFNKASTNPATFAVRIDSDQPTTDTYARWNSLCRLASAPGTTIQCDAPQDYVGQGWYVVNIRHDGTNFELFLDDELVDTIAASGNLDTTSGGDLAIGNHTSASNSAAVDIGDFVYFDYALTDGDRESVVEYLKNKFSNGVTVAGTEIEPSFSCEVLEDDSQYVMAYIETPSNTTILWATAPLDDPHNWTKQGTLHTVANGCGGPSLVKSGSTYYLFWDDRINGTINVATATVLGSFTDHGSNPVLSGTSGDEAYLRHPAVFYDDDNTEWVMHYNGRNGSVTSGTGASFRATSSNLTTWTRDSANNPIVDKSGNPDFYGTDAGSLCAPIKIDSTWYAVFSGFNEDGYDPSNQNPHQMGLVSSTDLETWTIVSDRNPLELHAMNADRYVAKGQPAWHPNDNSLLIVFEDENSPSGDEIVFRFTVDGITSTGPALPALLEGGVLRGGYQNISGGL